MTSHLTMPSRIRATALMAAVFAAVPMRPTSAQQACPAAHPGAAALVTRFLMDPSLASRRQAYGITAARAAELRPLTDATDAALCRRMDSVITPRPVYYYSAGSHIIASNAPAPDSIERVDERARYVFVLDSAGQFAYTVGETLPVVGPTGFHLVSGVPGAVTFAWTNGASSAMRYQLQRASAAGAFSSLGRGLLASTTNITDSSAVRDSVYRYRLTAVGPAGDSTYTSEVTVDLVVHGAIARTVAGFLFRDDFNRPDEPLGGPTKNWDRVTASAGTDADLNVVGNIARFTGNADNMPEAKHPPETGSLLVQTDWRRVSGGRTGIAIFESVTGNQAVFALRDPYHGWELWYHNGASWSNVQNSAGSLSDSTRLTLIRENTRVRMWAGGVLIFEWLNGSMNGVGARAGMYMINATTWDNFVACKGNTVTMSGLPSGYKLRVAGVVSAASTGAPVTVELVGIPLPAAQLEVLDPTNTVVNSYSPSDGVWGGDQYSYTP